MREEGAKGDLAVAEIAGRQHGVVATRQLLGAGLTADAVLRRREAGRLHRIHRGVYAVGHAALSSDAMWMAAVLACGRVDRKVNVGAAGAVLAYWGAALSHRSAAELWQLLPPREGVVDVTVPGDGGKRSRRGLRLHRSITLSPDDLTLRSGIPVTTVARTIADLRRSSRGKAPLVPRRELRRAIRQAEVLRMPLGDRAESDRTRSDLESDFLSICRRHRLPAPDVNVRVGPHLVDFLWRDRKLIVETDSFVYHGGLAAFQDDRARDLDLRARGHQVIRLAEKQVNEEPRRVAEVVSAALRVGADGSV